MKNWKTTVLGIMTLLLTGFKIYTNGGLQSEDMPSIAAGIGLITAKDSNVTGGTVNQ